MSSFTPPYRVWRWWRIYVIEALENYGNGTFDRDLFIDVMSAHEQIARVHIDTGWKTEP